MRVNFANSLLKYYRLLPVAIEHGFELRLSYKVSAPKHTDYREELVKTRDALRILKDPAENAKTKNQYLKTVIDKMVYERDPIVPITKENAEKFGVETSKGMNHYTPPYKITISLKCD